MKSLPNILTVMRLILTVGFVYFLLKSESNATIAALVLFAVASMTDYLDGFLARKYDVISNFGKIMDPIADKFLVLAAFFLFSKMSVIANWMFILICVREVVVTGSRFLAMSRGQVLAAEQAGKIKTVLQIGVIFVILFFLVFQETGVLSQNSDSLTAGWMASIDVLMFLTVGLTVYSGVSYFWSNRKLFLIQ